MEDPGTVREAEPWKAVAFVVDALSTAAHGGTPALPVSQMSDEDLEDNETDAWFLWLLGQGAPIECHVRHGSLSWSSTDPRLPLSAVLEQWVK